MTRAARGYSLLEVMLGLVILAILSSTLTLILTGGLKLLGQSERSDAANALASEMIQRIREYAEEPVEGVYDGRTPTPRVLGFPPSPYPSKTVSREYFFVVNLTSHDERLWHLKVEVYLDGTRRAANLECLLLK